MIPNKNRSMDKKNDRFSRTVCLLLAVILWIPLLSIGGGKAEAASGWSMIDGGGTNGLNVASANRAEYPAMAEWNGEVYLAWQEKVVSGVNASQIRVKKYNSTGWTSVDGNGPNGINMNTGKSGTRPTMAVFDGALYVAWVEEVTSSQGQIRIKKYNGNSSWTSAEGSSTSINFDATNDANFPALVAYNNALYATWVEAGKVYVKYYNGTEWTIVNGGANGINVNPGNGAAYPAIAVLGNELVVVWSEVQGSVFQLRAKKYNGTSWTTIDGGTTGLNMVNGKSANSPSVTVADGALYVAWNEPVSGATDDQIRVKKYESNAWTSVDGGGSYGINVSSGYRAYQVKLATVNHEVYAVWSENTGVVVNSIPVFKIRAKKYNGSTWTSAEDGRNGWIADATKAAFYPAVAVLNNALYVAWQEKNSTVEQVRAALLPPPAVNSITLTPNPVSLAQGGSKQLLATVDASGGADPTVSWTSSDAGNKVAVSSTGNVTVAADAVPGNYTITATSAFNNSKIGTATITVMLPTVNSVLVSPIRANITQGGSRQFNAVVDVVEGTEKTVNWTSSDTANKVTVDSTGNVTVAADAAPGTYTITATSTVDSSKKGTTTITVLAAPAINSVTVTPGTFSVAQGRSKQLTAAVDAVGGAATTVTWTSSDITNKVAVNSSGNVTVAADAALGDYTITATSTVNNGKKGTATITVTVPPAINGVTVTPGTSSVAQGGSKQLAASVDAVGGAATTVTWTSSDASKVAVSGTGNVTVAANATLGDYTITATSTADISKKGTATITVTAALIAEATPAAEIDYAAEQLTGLVRNGAYTLNGTAVTADGSGKVNIAGSWLGTTVNVVKKGNGTTTTDSAAQALILPARPATPSVGKTDETSINGNDGTLTNVTSAMEYKKGTAGSWTDVTGTSLTNLPPDTYIVRVKATSSAFASAAQTVTIGAFNASLETTPVAEIDYAAEQLTGLEPNGTYTMNGTAVTADGSGKVNIAGSWLGTTVNVVKKGNGTTTADSAAQTLTLPARPATPSVGKTDETSINGNDGTLTNVTSAMEYKKGTAGSWTDVTGTSLTNLPPDTYIVRVKATSSAFASEVQQVTIAAFGLSPETTPVAEIDYAAEQLTGLVPNGAYTINGTAVTADSSGKVPINGSWLGTTVNVVKKGNGTTTTDSAAQALTLPARPATPSAGKTDETSINGNDGTMTNVTSAMEYKKGTSGSWKDVTGTSLTNLPPDTYIVRVKATSLAFASEVQQVTIAAFGLSPETTPVAEIDYAAEQLTGLVPNGAYTINGTAVTADSSGKVPINGNWLGATVNVVKKGNGTTTADSAAQTLTLPARPATPSVGKTDETSINGNDGTLTNVTSAMEYRKGTAGSWTDVTGTSLTNLPPDTYIVRVKATSSAFASEVQQVTIAAFGLSPETTPVAEIDYAAEQLTGLVPNGAYTINGTAVTADSSGKVPINGNWLGTTLNVVKKGDGTSTTDSPVQMLSLSARPAAPNVSADDASNVIVGLDTTMEFAVGGGAYVRYDGTNMPQLSGEHTVHVRVAASGSVPAGSSATLIFTTNVSVPAGGLTVTAGDPSGSANNGKTRVTITPAVDDTLRLVYFNFGSGTVDVPNVGDTLSGYLNVPSDRMIPAANGDKIGIAEVDAQGRVVKFGQTAAIVIVEQPGPQPGNETSTGPKEEAVDVLINGKVENAGKATTTESGGNKTTTVVVDPAKLQAKLEAEGVNAVVTIPVKSASNVIVGELNGQMIKNMENLSATLVLQTVKGTYTLPTKEIHIDEVAGKLGSNVKLEDVQFKITVAQTPDTMAKIVQNAEAKGEFSVVAPALDFTVTGTYGGKTVEITAFNVYVERMVALPDGIDPNKITTGVVVEPDGTVRHVPTKINLIEGKYYAKINSLTNSTYAVVWHPLAFSDATNHWAKDAVNDMGSRMVIEGTGNGMFSPDRDITRAEFAAIIVRGLGLKLENEATPFADVNVSAWYNSAIHTAYAYHLISGFEDGTFRPNDKITREQAMAIIAKAMTITSLSAKLSEQSADVTLHPYVDATEVSAWAQSGVADNVQSGIITGRSGMKISPKAFITRAEVAVIVERLLRKSDLI